MSDPAWQTICTSSELLDAGHGLRFVVQTGAEPPQAAFVVRADGVARAFLNRCAHVPVELDWLPGKFFDDTGLYLICATHGALYRPLDGRCVAGPCRGRSLASLPCEEINGVIRVLAAPGESF